MKKKYISPSVQTITLDAESTLMNTTSLKLGGSSDSDAVDNESQVLSTSLWDYDKWSSSDADVDE